MGGFIILNDGRAYAAGNWAYRATVETIAEVLAATPEGIDLANWLRSDPIVQYYHSVDVRELTPANGELLAEAALRAFSIHQARGPVGWEQPEAWHGWLGRFRDLVQMIECVRRGEPPAAFNPHMNDVIPPTGGQAGPGW